MKRIYRANPLPRSGRLQAWLHKRRWPIWLLGNALSTLRYWTWRAFYREYDNTKGA